MGAVLHARAALSPGDGAETLGSISSWDLVTATYGPGTRFVLSVAGCPLRCLYCEVPGTWDPTAGVPVRVGDVLVHLRRYASLFAVTGGGITVSGGEPLGQPEFLRAVLRASREAGVHTAVATSGVLGDRLDDAALDDVDLTLLSLKAHDPAVFRRLTGGEVAPSLRFARRVAARGRALRVTVVLVPGVTGDRGNLERLADFVAGLGTVERVDVRPFPRTGQAGWAARGLRFPLAEHQGPTREALQNARELFVRRGVPTD